MSDAAQINFLRWLSDAHPAVYKKAVARVAAPQDLGDLGWINFVVQAVAAVGGVVMAKKQQKKQAALQKKALAQQDAQAAADRAQAAQIQLLEVNTKRAQAGLPPVDINGRVIPGSALPTPPALASYVNIPGVGKTSMFPILLGAGALLAVLVLRR